MTRERKPPPATNADSPLLVGNVAESPVEAGSREDDEGLDGFQYVTGEVPYRTAEERLLDEERTDERAEDHRDREAPEEVLADSVATDERDDATSLDDVDRQGRHGQEDKDWAGDMYADSGRDRPSDGSRRRH